MLCIILDFNSYLSLKLNFSLHSDSWNFLLLFSRFYFADISDSYSVSFNLVFDLLTADIGSLVSDFTDRVVFDLLGGSGSPFTSLD